MCNNVNTSRILSYLFRVRLLFWAFLLAFYTGSTSLTYASVETKLDTNSATKSALTNNNQDLLDDNYIIGPGDVLYLKVYDYEDASGQIKVLNDGSATIPLIGIVDLSGKTLLQANSIIKELISKELLRPELSLKVLTARPMQVSVIGEVQRPGIYTLSEGSVSNVEGAIAKSPGLPSVISAIQEAGGITQRTDLKRIELIRRLPGKEIKYKKANLDFIALILEGDQQQNPFLFDGDIIKLHIAEDNLEESQSIAAVNLSPQIIQISVIGEVARPGKFSLKSNTPLSQAIMASGGPINWRSNTGNVDLIRLNRNGSATYKQYKISLNEGPSENNPPLRTGDVIRVRRNSYAVATDSIKAVSEPLQGVVTLWSIFRILGN